MAKRLLGLVAVTSVVLLLAPVSHGAVDPAAVCKDKKSKAVGKATLDGLKAFGKNQKKTNVAKLGSDLSKAQSKLTKGFTKAEFTSAGDARGCETIDDASTIEAKVDTLVAEIVADLSLADVSRPIPDDTGDLKLDSLLQAALVAVIDSATTTVGKGYELSGLADQMEIVAIDDLSWQVGVLIQTDSMTSEGALESQVPTLDVSSPIDGPGYRIFTGTVELSLTSANLLDQPLWTLANLSGVQRVAASGQLDLDLDVSTAAGVGGAGGALRLGMGANPLQTLGYLGAGTTIGIVDTGIDTYHQDFRAAGGATRISSLWDQTLKPMGGEANPAGFAYGVEYTAASIGADFIAAPPQHTVVRSKDTDGHGTHVAGIAAGDGSSSANDFVGVAPEASLAVVKHNGTKRGVIDGVRYIFGKTGATPAVISLSVGTTTGPHDGESTYARGLADQTGANRIVVMAVGNDRAHAVHAENDGNAMVAGGAASHTTFNVPAGTTSFYIEAYTHQTNQMSIELTSPGAKPLKRRVRRPNIADAAATKAGAYAARWTIGGKSMHVKITNNESGFGIGGLDRRMTVQGTLPKPALPAPNGIQWAIIPGVWTLSLHPLATLTGDGLFDAWLTSTPGPAAVVFTANAVNDEKVTDPACNGKIIAVGSHTSKLDPAFPGAALGTLSSFSNPGPTREPTAAPAGRTKPDLSGPGQLIESARSKDSPLPAGTDAFHTRLRGTSMAAPHVAGFIAVMLSISPGLTPANTLAHLDDYFTVRDAVTGVLPNNDWGRGKLLASNDSDEDGFNNLVEVFVLGTDPLDPDDP